MNLQEIIIKLKQMHPIQKHDLDESNLMATLKEMNAVVVADGLAPDEHRWYETSIIVFKFPNGECLGVRAVTSVYSETCSIDDLYWSYEFMEMEEIMKGIMVTSYVPKRQSKIEEGEG